jgi:hypothetical protein
MTDEAKQQTSTGTPNAGEIAKQYPGLAERARMGDTEAGAALWELAVSRLRLRRFERDPREINPVPAHRSPQGGTA